MKRSLLVWMAFAWLGCASGPKYTVADQELLRLSAEARGPIDEAKGKVSEAERVLAAAKKAGVGAARAVKLADLQLDRAQLDVEIAKLRFDVAEDTKDADAMLPAQTERKAAGEALKIAEAELPYRKAQERQQLAITEEAEAALAEARAELELAKLVAVLETKPDVGLEGEKRRADFKAQLAAAQSRRAEAKQTVSAVALEVDSARRNFETLRPASAANP